MAKPLTMQWPSDFDGVHHVAMPPPSINLLDKRGNGQVQGKTEEDKMAEMEKSRNISSDAYFSARPQLEAYAGRRLFEAGFQRAWEAQQKKIDDLTTRLNAALREKGYEPT